MQTNLTKDGSRWTIEVLVNLDDGPTSKSFGSREEAEAWRERLAQGLEEVPVAKAAPQKVAPKLKVVGDMPTRKKGK